MDEELILNLNYMNGQNNYRLAHIGYDSNAAEVTVFTDYPPLNRPGTDTNDSNDPYSSTFDTNNARGAVP